jgi:amino acid permease
MLSFAAILYVVAVVVAQFFERPGAADAGPLDAWGAWPSLVLAVPNVMLSLQAHIQIPSIYADMRPSLRSVNAMTAAAAAAYALIAALYGIIAVFGLLTFRRDTQPNIMECDYRAGDPSIVAARACLALTAVFSIPVNHHRGATPSGPWSPAGPRRPCRGLSSTARRSSSSSARWASRAPSRSCRRSTI